MTTSKERMLKHLWLIEAILCEDPPRTSGDIAQTTGLSRDVVDDCCWELERRGLIRCRVDSKLEWVKP